MTGGSGRVMLITGATGFIGSHLAIAAADTYVVRSLTRTDWTGPPAVPTGRRYFGNLPFGIPESAFEDVHVVVHCAATAEPNERKARAINVDGTVRLAELARKHGVETLIFLSSQSARPDAISAYGRTKFLAEQELLSLHGLRVIILRPGLVVGPGSSGLFSRLVSSVMRLPLVPLPDGGRGVVQPIQVDDLCEAILRCDRESSELDRAILKLGDPKGERLADFVQEIAMAYLGHPRPTVSIPLGPIEAAVRHTETLRLPLPISSTNLRGLRTVELMPTADDMERLGIPIRTVSEMLRMESMEGGELDPLDERAVRLLLVGAGRVGFVHALTLSRLRGAVLVGIVDRKPGAVSFLQKLGVASPGFRELDNAIEATRADAAVIATPPGTHLPLALTCLQRGLSAMVEKPLARTEGNLEQFERLISEFPDQALHVGYLMPRLPTIAASLDDLRAGRLGRVEGFMGVTLVSLIEGGETKRWEVLRDSSGGGALINAGGHVLSMIRAAFGDPETIEAQTARLGSTEVEDSIVVSFEYPGFRGVHYCSWSIPGFPRQRNVLNVYTDRGRLMLVDGTAVFVGNDGVVELRHSLDVDVGFNVAPDYVGAGFTVELNDLATAVRTGRPGPMEATEAIALERVLFGIYRAAREVRTFSVQEQETKRLPTAGLALTSTKGARKPAKGTIQKILDLRDLDTDSVSVVPPSVPLIQDWDGLVVSAAQSHAMRKNLRGNNRVRITLPDFQSQSRLLAMARYGEVIRRMGVSGVTRAARAAAPIAVRERGPTFWVAGFGMLGAALKEVPQQFQGTLLLHGSLADTALILKRLDMLERLLITCRRARPRARVGFHTSLTAEAPNAIALLDTPVDELSVLTSPDAIGMSDIVATIREAAPAELSVLAEIGPGPAVLHRIAAMTPEPWAHGADAVVIGLDAVPALADARRRQLAQAWAEAFPGLSLPEEMPW
jgi:predicted dehydrogenase/nucleoside-diphosphate-sugar epimerase